MSKVIEIGPVTKIEGHGKITVFLDDNDQVKETHFNVVEFRGFEKFCEGRLFMEMPLITSRICGICPVSHHLVSAKACDDLLKIRIPATAKMIRELMHMGQFIHSHALHVFYLSGSDFIMGVDSDPAIRNIVGVIGKDPELAKKAVRLRQIGQNIIERVGGRAIHPMTAIPGGVSRPVSHEDRFKSLEELKEALDIAKIGLSLFKDISGSLSGELESFDTIPTLYLGLVKDGNLELYDGELRLIDSKGNILEQFDPRDYLDYIEERVEDYSYLKFPYYKKLGYPAGIYRVGPLARLNVANAISTPLANEELIEFKKLGNGGPVHETFYYHYARFIELLYTIERAQELLQDDRIVNESVRVKAQRNEGAGVGVFEAPRGVIIHHYTSDMDGKLTDVNFIVATNHNNPAMNLSVNEVAKKVITKGKILQEGDLNRIEMAIRAYDPCLSCSTHAHGQMPLKIEVVDKNNNTIIVADRG